MSSIIHSNHNSNGIRHHINMPIAIASHCLRPIHIIWGILYPDSVLQTKRIAIISQLLRPSTIPSRSSSPNTVSPSCSWPYEYATTPISMRLSYHILSSYASYSPLSYNSAHNTQHMPSCSSSLNYRVWLSELKL